jgi:hypothetical protein
LCQNKNIVFFSPRATMALLKFFKRAALNVEAIHKIQNEDRLQQEAFERVKKKSEKYSGRTTKSPLYTAAFPTHWMLSKEKEV